MLKKFDLLGPLFWKKDIEKGNLEESYNFEKYKRNGEIYCRQATKLWGWNRRDLSQELCTEFFTIYKFICLSEAAESNCSL